MGLATNARGQLRQAQRVDAEILRMLAGTLQPDSLTPQELGLERNPVTRPARAEPVWAWVHYGSRSVRVEAELAGWTSAAGAIRWEVSKVGIHRAWVWLNAIEPRPQRPGPGE